MAAIPAMSAECERIFSSAKILLSDQRARMKPILIEAYECLRHWLLSATDDILKRTPPQYDKDAVKEARAQALQEEADAADSATAYMSDIEDVDSDDGDDNFLGSYEVQDS